MKKVFLFLVASVFAICANAQFYVGGTFGYLSEDNGSDITHIKILPELGYKMTDAVSFGATLGYTKNWSKIIPSNNYNQTSEEGYTVQPYLRYKIASSGKFSLSGELDLSYTKFTHVGYEAAAFVRPVLSFDLTNHFSLVSKFGFLGYDKYSPDAENASETTLWGVNLDGNSLEFGAIYNF